MHLNTKLECDLWQHPDRPATCHQFRPDPEVCGQDRSEALRLLGLLEDATGSN